MRPFPFLFKPLGYCANYFIVKIENRENETMCAQSAEIFPTEIYVNILSNLNERELLPLTAVCRVWHQIIHSFAIASAEHIVKYNNPFAACIKSNLVLTVLHLDPSVILAEDLIHYMGVLHKPRTAEHPSAISMPSPTRSQRSHWKFFSRFLNNFATNYKVPEGILKMARSSLLAPEDTVLLNDREIGLYDITQVIKLSLHIHPNLAAIHRSEDMLFYIIDNSMIAAFNVLLSSGLQVRDWMVCRAMERSTSQFVDCLLSLCKVKRRRLMQFALKSGSIFKVEIVIAMGQEITQDLYHFIGSAEIIAHFGIVPSVYDIFKYMTNPAFDGIDRVISQFQAPDWPTILSLCTRYDIEVYDSVYNMAAMYGHHEPYITMNGDRVLNASESVLETMLEHQPLHSTYINYAACRRGYYRLCHKIQADSCNWCHGAMHPHMWKLRN